MNTATASRTAKGPANGPANRPTKNLVRHGLVATIIGSFCIAAFMGILALLGSEFGELQAKVLGTTVLIGVANLIALANLSTWETPWAPLGFLGATLTSLWALLGLALIWLPSYDANVDKAFFVVLVLALTNAQLCMLLPTGAKHPKLRPILALTTATALTLAGILTLTIVESIPDEDSTLRLIGIVGILDALGSVVVLALAIYARFSTPHAEIDASASARAARRSGRFDLPTDLVSAITAAAAGTGGSPQQLVTEAVQEKLERIWSQDPSQLAHEKSLATHPGQVSPREHTSRRQAGA